MDEEYPPSIGIDLGTTYTCVAVCRNGKVDIIPNAQGKRTTPSCVAYAENERIVGDAAMQQLARNPKNTVFDVKRMIGMPFKNPSLQTDRRRWAFKVKEVEEKPKIEVSQGRTTKSLWPEEISGAILEEMKRVASEFIGKNVTSAVITVPAYFNDSQRQATKFAAELAELHVIGMTNEPTAAAIAYGLDNKSDRKINVLIFDMGGGTFDVTVLSIEQAIFDVKATEGNTHLGGQDFTDRLFKYFAAEFMKKTKLDIMKDDRAKYRLRAECEKAKRTLSSSMNASVYLDSLYQGRDFDGTITRAAFEQLNRDLFRESLETVESALKNAKMEKNMIDHVLLIGGSTRIPYIEEMLKKYFTESKICKNINPDEAVAYGAAVRAAFLAGDVTPLLNFELRDVTPQSLGVEVRGSDMSFLIRKNTKIPVKVWDEYCTADDNQTGATIKVFEGDKEITKLNNLLGKLQLSNIPPKPAGEVTISVCFEIDSNGVLHVSAVDKLTGNKRDAVIEKYASMRSEEETKRMKNDADRARKQDKQTRERRAAMNELEEAILDAKNRADGLKSITMKYLVKECDEMLQWFEDNQETAKIQEIKEKSKHLKMLVAEVFPGTS